MSLALLKFFWALSIENQIDLFLLVELDNFKPYIPNFIMKPNCYF